MTQGDILLQAILDDPDDDGIRLVYSDWLEEHGEHERAEFIRVQIELADPGVGGARRKRLKRREGLLLWEYREAWLGPLNKCGRDWKFRRGLAEEVTMATQTFLDNADALFRSWPIRHLHLYHAAGLMDPLAGCPHLARLADLDLSGNRLHDSVVRVLAGCSHLAGLSGLNLSNNRIGDKGARVLANSPYLGSLRVLGLNRNSFGVAGLVALNTRFGDRVVCRRWDWSSWPPATTHEGSGEPYPRVTGGGIEGE
jgi:uncharacterized protein (TIGR02996 family)